MCPVAQYHDLLTIHLQSGNSRVPTPSTSAQKQNWSDTPRMLLHFHGGLTSMETPFYMIRQNNDQNEAILMVMVTINQVWLTYLPPWHIYPTTTRARRFDLQLHPLPTAPWLPPAEVSMNEMDP
mmetsp:Transcript_30452/g.55264  ORF Transcript_30452/g.55264 Transcript_30452/m.55264 type:complete len:124 (-) Transcript_30452:499-870(-)